MGYLENHSSFTNGTIVSKINDNYYEVRLKGRNSTVKMRTNVRQEFMIGQSVSIGRIEGDNQKMSILGYSTHASP